MNLYIYQKSQRPIESSTNTHTYNRNIAVHLKHFMLRYWQYIIVYIRQFMKRNVLFL